MRRLVWIAVALLIMVAILGYGLFTMRSIKEVNQRRREQDAGKQEAVKIIATEPTTSVWDRLHATEETGNTAPGGAAPNGQQFSENTFASEGAEMPSESIDFSDMQDVSEETGFTEIEQPTGETVIIRFHE